MHAFDHNTFGLLLGLIPNQPFYARMQQFTSCAVLYLLLFTVGTLGRVAPQQHHSPLPRHNENSTKTADTKNELEKIEDLCVRTHNNTAFMGIEPFSRILLNSASDCRKNCLETYPKCVGVMFYYVHSGDENQKHICYLFDKNSVNEEVALVPEKPSSPLDMVRALEVVVNCHEFDPVPPLEENFVKSSDNVPLKKRDVGFDRPVIATGPWTGWSVCSPTNNVQLRTRPCEYGRFVQRRRCYSTAGGLGGSAVLAGSGISGVSGVSGVSGISGSSGVTGVSGVSGISELSGVTGVSGVSGISELSGVTGVSGVSGMSGSSGVTGVSGVSGISELSGVTGVSGISEGLGGLVSSGSVQPTASVSIAVPYPPSPYIHPSFQTSEYARIMGQHQEQMQKSCCYRQQYVLQQLQNQYHPATDTEQQGHYAVPAVPACAQPCVGQYGAVSAARIGHQVTPTLSATPYTDEVYQPPQPQDVIITQLAQPQPSVIVQPQPSVTVQPQSSLIGQPQPSVIVQSRPSVIGQRQPSVIVQPQPSVIVQPQPSVIGQPQPSVIGQPQPSVIGQPQPSVIVQSQPSVIGQPQPSVIGQPQPSVIVQPQVTPATQIYGHTLVHKPTLRVPYYFKPGATHLVDSSAATAGLACQWSEWWGWNHHSNGILRRSRICIGDNDCVCYGAAVQQAVCSNCAGNVECVEACKKK